MKSDKSDKRKTGNLNYLIRSLRTKKYEKYKIQGDSLSVIPREESKKDNP